MTDQELLHQYVESHSQQAFAELVDRHKDWLYSTCLRRMQNAHMAEDAAQATFITLARKARSLLNHTSLAGWLYQTACFTVADAQKRARRRAQHETEAVMMATLASAESNEETWERIAPLLEPALDRLPQKHRLPILLRFYERKTHPQIAEVLGISEDAAKKRLSRALDLLRAALQSKGVVFPATALATLLLAHSVQAAPVTLSASTVLATLAAGTGVTWTLSQGALHMIFWSQAKTALVVCSLAGGLTVSGLAVNHALAQRAPVALAQVTGAGAPAAPSAPVIPAAPASPPPAGPAVTATPSAPAAPPAPTSAPAAEPAPETATNGQTPSAQGNTYTGGTLILNAPLNVTATAVQGNTLPAPANGNFVPAQAGGQIMIVGNNINVPATLVTNPTPGGDALSAFDAFEKALADLDDTKAAAALQAENQEEKDYVAAFSQLVKSLSQVKSALVAQKFAEADINPILQQKLSPLPFTHVDVNVAETADDNSSSLIRPNGPLQPLPMAHQDGVWKFPVKSLFSADALVPSTATAKHTAQNMEALTADIKSGKIKSLKDFEEAFKKASISP